MNHDRECVVCGAFHSTLPWGSQLPPATVCPRPQRCRASLSPGTSPSLQAAGATLAATFLEKGLAGGDATVLNRLMALLVAPLAQWAAAAPPEALYAEWVDVRAKVRGQ